MMQLVNVDYAEVRKQIQYYILTVSYFGCRLWWKTNNNNLNYRYSFLLGKLTCIDLGRYSHIGSYGI